MMAAIVLWVRSLLSLVNFISTFSKEIPGERQAGRVRGANCRSIRNRTFDSILENFSGLRVHTNFVDLCAVLDVERVAKTTSAMFPFEFLVGNLARASSKSRSPRRCQI